MGICYVCGREVDMPHRCPYCNLTYCDEHRIPEQHNCSGLPKREWSSYKGRREARNDAKRPSIIGQAWKKLRRSLG